MRTEEINKWIEEGGDLPQDLTQEEKEHLTKLGWSFEENRYENGEKSERHYLRGKEHGKQEGWHENGQKRYEWNYLHGKEHGKWKWWHENGQKWHEEGWFHGMKHGVFKEWDLDGNLTYDEEYYYGNKIK